MPDAIMVRYTNWRGETRTREVMPTGAPRWGATDWHPQPGWLLPVLCFEPDGTTKEREFALADCDFRTTETTDA